MRGVPAGMEMGMGMTQVKALWDREQDDADRWTITTTIS